MHKFFSFLILLFYINIFIGQNTVGLISYDPAQSYEDYNVIFPHNQSNVYLLNNCEEIVHSWTDSFLYRPGNTAYILDDGNLVKCKRIANISGDPIWAGGGAIVEIRSWENDLLWSFELNDPSARLHHDIASIPLTGMFL